MKNVKKVCIVLLSVCILGMIVPSETFAASSRVTVSSASGNVSSNVTITCTMSVSGTSIGGADVELRYDVNALKPTSTSSGAHATGGAVYYSSSATAEGQNSLQFTVTFQILKTGQHSVSVFAADVYAWDNTISLGSPSMSGGTITGKTSGSGGGSSSGGGTTSGGGTSSGGGSTSGGGATQNSKDKNNKLSSLQIYPGTLSPAFNAGTTSYNVTVPDDTTEVTISATPQSNKARVTVSGDKNLKRGINTAQVVVVAENGSSIAYTITIMGGEEEQILIGGINHKIDESFTAEQIPSGFSRTKITYNNRQYEGLTNAKGNLQLISLISGDHAIYYIYNQTTQEFYNFVQINIADGKYIIPLPLSDKVIEFKDYKTVPITYQEKSFDGWKLNEEFSVTYVMNQDGEEVLYRYDHVDGTFQRFTDVKVEDVDANAGKSMFPNQYYMYAIIGLGAFCFILLISMIYFIASRKHRHEGRKKNVIKKQEKQKAKEEKQRLKEEKILEKQRAIADKELARQQAAHEKAEAKQRAIDEKEAAKQRAIEEKEAEKQRKIEEKQRRK